jgi:hypothetical protein
MTFDEALARIRPGLDHAERMDLPDDFVDDTDELEAWAPLPADAGGGPLEAAEGDYFEGQDALYESASRIALSLVR